MRFSPALCIWYTPTRLAFPCFAQPKLNGLRAIYKDGHFYSRSGNQWSDTLLTHILEPLRTNCGCSTILDGEFYRHGWTLDRIAEAVSLFRKDPCKDTSEIGFYVFDLVAETPFQDRSLLLNSQLLTLNSQLLTTLPVPTIRVDSLAAADAFHNLNLQAGFEGTIYRTGRGDTNQAATAPCSSARKPAAPASPANANSTHETTVGLRCKTTHEKE